MKLYISIYLLAFITALGTTGCGNSQSGKSSAEEDHHDHGHGHGHGAHNENVVRLSLNQFKELGMVVDTISSRNLGSFVEANGQLEVPPQNEATVTATMGANVVSIKVIEGDKVNKGQVIAYLSHPSLIELQTEYVDNWSQLQYLENEYKRHRDLNENQAVSDRDFQQVRANYLSTKARAAGDGAQLVLLGLSLTRLREGTIYNRVPLKSPIAGYVRLVNAKIGQYVLPETSLFEIVNIDHIHADLMVFEKDLHKVKEEQKVRFTVESLPNKELEAVIYSVGKAFEQGPKAVHLHAEITNKEGLLIPGMYVKGSILVNEEYSLALPEDALIKQEDKHYAFTAEKRSEQGHDETWEFEFIEVQIVAAQGKWVGIEPLKPLKKGTLLAMNNAFYLMAELKKEEAEHTH